MGQPLDHPPIVGLVGFVVDTLCERNEEHRTRRLVQSRPRKLRVAYDADDAERARILGPLDAEVLIERIFIAPEEALHERLVNDCNRSGRLVVRCRKQASPHDRDAQVLKIIGTDAVPGGAHIVARVRRMAGDQNCFAPARGERIVQRESGSTHAGEACEPLLDVAIERRQPIERVRRRQAVQADQYASLHFVAEVLVFEVRETSREHGGAGDHHDGQRCLNDQQRGARAGRMMAGAAARAAQRIDWIGPRSKPCRRGAEYDACHQRPA